FTSSRMAVRPRWTVRPSSFWQLPSVMLHRGLQLQESSQSRRQMWNNFRMVAHLKRDNSFVVLRRKKSSCDVFRPSTHFARSKTAADPVLELKSGDALEFAFIVGDDSEPRVFGVSSNPEIVATDHLTAGLQRRANLAVGCRRFPRQGNHRQKRYKAPERFQGVC